jgi:hypothetical protein
MPRLESADVTLANTRGLGVQGPDDLCSVFPVAVSMRHSGLRPAKAAGRALRIVALVPCVADQDEPAADVAGRKLSVAAAAVVEGLSG